MTLPTWTPGTETKEPIQHTYRLQFFEGTYTPTFGKHPRLQTFGTPKVFIFFKVKMFSRRTGASKLSVFSFLYVTEYDYVRFFDFYFSSLNHFQNRFGVQFLDPG